MYKVLIETSLPDLLIVLIKDDNLIDFVHESNLVKKSEQLPVLFTNLLNKYQIKIDQINAFYITLGPGSFMGARVALMFARTICQITNCQLFTTSSLHFISQNHDGTYYVDAKSGQSYQGIVTNNQIKISLQSFHVSTKIDYQQIINNIDQYLPLFSLQKNILQIKPFYLKEPQVGTNEKS